MVCGLFDKYGLVWRGIGRCVTLYLVNELDSESTGRPQLACLEASKMDEGGGLDAANCRGGARVGSVVRSSGIVAAANGWVPRSRTLLLWLRQDWWDC